jgi:hypothetical protein
MDHSLQMDPWWPPPPLTRPSISVFGISTKKWERVDCGLLVLVLLLLLVGGYM